MDNGEVVNVISVAEAAAALGISERAVQDRLRRGVMRGRRIGARVWVIPAAEVETWRERGRLPPGRKPQNA